MTPRLPMLKARDLLRVLSRMGFVVKRQEGSHIFLEHVDGRVTVVPQHGSDDIGRGLLRQIFRDIEISPKEFEDFFREL